VKLWADYNARLSYVFQNSQPVIDIAILGPTADLWSREGFDRVSFHTQPWYLHELWEPLSQAGSSCDYVNEKIIRMAECRNGTLCYGPMSYKALVLADVRSIQPETARAIEEYAEQGGTVLFIGQAPSRSPSFRDAETKDQQVKDTVRNILTHSNSRVIESPDEQDDLLDWVLHELTEHAIEPSVRIRNPQPGVYQIFHTAGDKEIVFFVNSFYEKPITLEIDRKPGKTPYVWNPETGERTKLRLGDRSLSLHFDPLESLLLIWENNLDIPERHIEPETAQGGRAITSDWHITFEHINGKVFEKHIHELTDLAGSGDRKLETFTGTITYSTSFSNQDRDLETLDLGDVNSSVTEVTLNGRVLGCRWYGSHIYDISNSLREGQNTLKIKLVPTLANYARSLTDNPAAMAWAAQYEISPTGLMGPVRLLRKTQQ
jgi:hypothetical protein